MNRWKIRREVLQHQSAECRGQSEGQPDPYHNVISGSAALEWVHQHKDPNPLIVYGQSMGGIIAMRTAIEQLSKKEKFP